MKPPFILNESPQIDGPGDLSIWGTAEELELQVEAIDVEEGIYFVFDSEGSLLRLVTDGQAVKLVENNEDPQDPAILHRLLSARLMLDGVPEDWCRKASLRDLIAASSRYYESLTPAVNLRQWLANKIARLFRREHRNDEEGSR